MQIKRAITLLVGIVLMATVCLCITGCGTDDIDISKYAKDEIVLSGLQDEDITITIADLKALECKTVKTESTSDKIGEVKATGPELGTVLEQYGFTKEDIKSVRFHGIDEYDVPLLNKYITEHDIYLAFGIDGEPLDAEAAPCRIIIPESDSAYWIRMVNEIEFER